MQPIRSLLFDVILVIWTTVLSPSVLFMYLFKVSSSTIRRLSIFWAHGIIVLLHYIVGIKYKEVGAENIPPGPLLIICNHQSAFETFLLPVLFRSAVIVAKIELARIPVVGWCLKHYPMIMIDRSAGAGALAQLRREAEAAVKNGHSVLIFPEGTRKSVGEEIVFQRGVEYLYKALSMPVLPVVVNSGLLWGRDRLMRRSGTVTVSYLPIIPSGLDTREFKRIAESRMNLEKNRLAGATAHDALVDAVG